MSGRTFGGGTAVLVLEDGRAFRGTTFGAVGQTLGEAVFTTAMTGYQETLTDPSYHRQIVVATAPQIGNTGWNDEDNESVGPDGNAADSKIWVAGYVVRDPSRTTSSWRATGTLQDELERQKVVGIAGIDTRALVRHLRTLGSMRAGIFSGDALAWNGDDLDIDALLDRVKAQPPMLGANLAREVTTTSGYVVEPEGEARFDVAALDLGIKSNTPRLLAARGIRVHVLPATTTLHDILDLKADGVFLSNGPGDPAAVGDVVHLTKEILGQGLPLFGICFGNQILGRALGLNTYKMKFGHRGLNIPVIDHETGQIAITSQNHGFALEGEAGQEFDTPFGRAKVTHTCANDGVVEGVRLLDGSAFSVQYHPEAAAGPHDAVDLFDRFTRLLEGEKN
ncbi:carbamoyl phosphate synthase small subunit [Rhodococcus sp. 852002-51564_SCH6189132-a]|uniref:glutamine-hydrolyzing carbamoyl-phosphate synthase small subunit n=1 Tax=unclassified Rhodococcus (in: high G+C Gram-positive bacteria) TaxID=192944 RepID=UPI0007E927A1|nr:MULTISPECIES: glutamine-hydrolyzing carbamoyl-phosphate synthase small subunit [unclassified Rhodococcus (in: high G+C Gram-positive bacteria)]MBX4167508.1 glutamine-hydrolyzing carbamoyl-phosphate synthase small subunit [Rhodococcus sp. DMU2021]OBA36073.1 carbamoyl phosphate synthase small subunit [Rhodococcus sp. 852002-51564_SCH6189132-a]